MNKKLSVLLLALATTMLIGCGSKAQETEKQVKTIDDLTGARIGVQLGTIGDIYASDYEGDEEWQRKIAIGLLESK